MAALNIYNGLLQADESPITKKFAALSEQELDRIETLVQNLLKITRLDVGAVVFEKKSEQIADILQEIMSHAAFRAKKEGKSLVLSGDDAVALICDRDWLSEAIDNIIKNALDHTNQGDTISISWKALPTAVQIAIKDNGTGIHAEDLPHIFKRFYRSRYAQDKQGIGLGLPLAKTIIEAHNGVVTVDSVWKQGTVFTIDFYIPTKM